MKSWGIKFLSMDLLNHGLVYSLSLSVCCFLLSVSANDSLCQISGGLLCWGVSLFTAIFNLLQAIINVLTAGISYYNAFLAVNTAGESQLGQVSSAKLSGRRAC